MAKDYFSHDYNARNDKKLTKVFMKHNLAGIGAYWCIIEMLYEEGGYLLIDEYERIAFELRADFDFIKSVIEDFDLFENDDVKIWSDTALERLKLRAEKSQKARESIEKRWNKHKNNTNVLQSKNNSNTIKVKESKVKESKKDIEERKNIFKNEIKLHKQYDTEMLKNFFNYWSEPTKDKSKMRMELQKTWDTKGRLSTWFNRSQNDRK